MSAEEAFVVRVVHSYSRASDEQLSLVKGELLTVVARDHSGWWIGRNGTGAMGLFPSTYVQRETTEPPPDEAASTIAKERLLRSLELRALAEVVRGAEKFPRLLPGASGGKGGLGSSVYIDDLFSLEPEELSAELNEAREAIAALTETGVASFSSVVAARAELESDSTHASLQQQLTISQARLEKLRREVRDADEDRETLLDNLKEAQISVPECLRGAPSKRPVRGKSAAPAPAALAPTASAPAPSMPSAAANADDIPAEWLDKAQGDVDVGRYYVKLAAQWEALNLELNTLEGHIAAAEKAAHQAEAARAAAEKEAQAASTNGGNDATTDADGSSPSAQKELRKLLKKATHYEAELEAARAELQTLTRDAEELKNLADSRAATFAELDAKVEAARAAAAGTAAQLAALDQQTEELRRQISEAHSQRDAALEAAAKIRREGEETRRAEVAEYRQLERERRMVYNELQELRGNLRVYCRLRPRGAAEKVSVVPVDDITLRVTDPVMETTADYEFDLVLPEQATQAEVFNEVQPLVTSVLDGFNVTVFAYGQTGSGKTHTMEGSASDRGISFRTLTELFGLAKDRVAEGYNTVFNVSVLEVYNDKIFDLLDGRKATNARYGGRDVGVVVQPMKLVQVTAVQEVEALLAKAYENRSVAGTDCNAHSSRSHCLLTVHVASENPEARLKINAKLHLIDLAGSERVKNSGVEGARLKEATFINTSLTHLKSVIQALAQKNDAHVPFRNSALTSLLQDSLGGNCKCLMFANVSPLSGNVPETVCTLKYASEARKVVVGKVTAKVTKT